MGENNGYRRKPGRDILKRTTVVSIVLIASSFHAWAGLDEGKAAYEVNDYKTALAEFLKDQKNPDALAWIGSLYQQGKGVKQDQQIAAKWMDKAAKAGQAWAAYKLAGYYADGLGVKKDPKLAFQWAQKAVDEGNVDAIAVLARMYLFGQGTTKDIAKAKQHLQIGCEKGDSDSMQELGKQLYLGENFEKDLPSALNWLKKSVDAGNKWSAPFILGLMHGNGDGIDKDPAKGVEYYKIAAENGHSGAQNNLGLAYWYGNGVRQDLGQAARWFEQASKNGSDLGQKNLSALNAQIDSENAAAQQREAAAIAQRERIANSKRAPGTRLCSSGSGIYQEYQGIYILGKPYFKPVNGTNTIMAFVERAAPPKLSLRVARIDFLTVDRRTINIANHDHPDWGQLSPGAVFWSDEYAWEPC